MKSFLAVAACATALIAAPASAATFTTFTQQGGTDTVSFANNGDGTGTLSAINSGIYDFTFLSPFLSFLPPELTTAQNATFTMTGAATSPAGFSAGVVEQSISSGTITFTRETPFEGKSNLLTIEFTNAFLWGPLGASGLNLIASNAIGDVSFTSDFIDFSGSTQRDFNFSFQGLNTPVAIGAGGVMGSFTGDASGLASVNVVSAAVPEPATWAMMILGFGGVGVTLRTRKRLSLAA